MDTGKKLKGYLTLDSFIVAVLVLDLIIYYFQLLPQGTNELLAVAVSYLTTLPVLWSAGVALKNKKISVDLLASVALIFSLIQREWPSVLFINLMIASARIFADYTKNRSRRAIESLLKLKSEKVKVQIDGGFKEVNINQVRKGDLALIELGERIPVDGIVEKGEADVDQSALTGESLPVFKKSGDKVFSPTVVISGNLTVRVEKVGKETALERIVGLVEESKMNKAPISRMSDRFGSWYIGLALVGSLVLLFIYRDTRFVLSVLLVACADDIAVALPLAFLASISNAAKRGVIVKGGNFLEALAKIKVIVVDKTGTLTRGKLKVEKIYPFYDRTETETLALAGTASFFSSHPLSHALTLCLKEKNLLVEEPENFEEYPGRGIKAIFRKKTILFGKVDFIKEMKVKLNNHQEADIDRANEGGLSVAVVACDSELVGFITFEDRLRPNIKEIIARLKTLGVEKIVMLTGDNEKIASRIAEKTGIEEFHANLLPEDKITYLKKYLNKKYKVAMIGDGVNDAANLSLADVGIAMGVIGSDAAIESADIALMHDNLSQLPELIKLSRETLKVAKQDLWMWGIINAVGLTLVFLGVLGPAGAAAFNFITDFFPPINSTRLFK